MRDRRSTRVVGQADSLPHRLLAPFATLALIFSGALSADQVLEQRLTTGEGISAQLRGGEGHTYIVPLRAGQFLSAVVEQKGVDVEVTVTSPAGNVVAHSDLPNADRGPEPVMAIAEATGDYKIVVRAGNATAPPGQYEVRVEAVRPPTAEDRLRIEAERLVDEAATLASKRTAEAIAAAIQKDQAAAAYFHSTANVYREALTVKAIGGLRAGSGNFRGAVEAFEAARLLFRSGGDQAGEASAGNNAGGAYDVLGNVGAAMERYKEASALYRAVGQRALEANTLNNIGKLFADMADWQQATEYYRAALGSLEGSGDVRRESTVLQNLGNAYWLIDPQRAIEYQEKALALRRSSHDRAGEAQTLGEMGGIYNSAGKFAEAIRSAEEALAIQRSLNDRPGQARTLRTLGLAHARLGHADEAATLLNESLAMARSTQDRRREGLSLLALGWAQALAGKAQPARESFAAARTIAEQLGDTDTLANSLRGMAGAERELGNLVDARRDAEASLLSVEKERSNTGGSEARSSFLSTALEGYELYIDILMLQHDAAAALETSERSHARSLLEMLSESRADIREGVDPKLIAREREITNLLNAKGTRLLPLMGRDTPQATALKQEVRALETEYQDVEAAIQKSSPRYAALTQPSPLKLKQIQEDVLDAGSLLLEYSLGEKRSYLWAVSKTGIHAWELAPRARIETAVRNVLQLVTSRADAALPAAARELSDLVVAPAAATLAGKRLIIVADGALQQIPFAMLPIPGSREPLLTAHEIVSLPSASALAVLRNEAAGRQPATKTLAVFADPVFDAGDAAPSPEATRILEHLTDRSFKIPRLPFTAIEADQILRVAGGTGNWKATGYQASRAAALNGQLSQYRYVHFATHGILDTERPSLSALVLSQVDENQKPVDGFLRVNDIYNTRLSADLVVLSACQTGLGKEVRGEGLMGLTRAFLYAGAPRVVVSLWSVNDRATADLMAALYRGMLRQGKTPSAALRAAQLELRKQKRWESPYYWAAFVQHGEWR
jgi:CHAT domain-containing protein/tetratricopeptide (TPR) repeat protein